MMPRKDSVLKFICTEYRCCLVTSHEDNLLPFSTPQSYAVLSAESKTTQAANNKEMLLYRIIPNAIILFRIIPNSIRYNMAGYLAYNEKSIKF
jgi:hypothetical protein